MYVYTPVVALASVFVYFHCCKLVRLMVVRVAFLLLGGMWYSVGRFVRVVLWYCVGCLVGVVWYSSIMWGIVYVGIGLNSSTEYSYGRTDVSVARHL